MPIDFINSVYHAHKYSEEFHETRRIFWEFRIYNSHVGTYPFMRLHIQTWTHQNWPTNGIHCWKVSISENENFLIVFLPSLLLLIQYMSIDHFYTYSYVFYIFLSFHHHDFKEKRILAMFFPIVCLEGLPRFKYTAS